MKTEEELMSGEELFRRPDLNPCELVDGRVVPMTPTGCTHGVIEARLVAKLLAYAEARGSGKALAGEVGIYIRRNPDTVRAADALFISDERFARRGPSGFLDAAPELVVEILSPEDRWSEVMAKLGDYFSLGVDLIWVVDPKLRKVFAYRSLTDVEQFEPGQVLANEALLPGFALPVADLFRD
jgi:Uma2 family endonuclease